MGALPVLIARLSDHDLAIAFVKAALKRRVAVVPLDVGPDTGGDHLLLVHAPGLADPILLAAVIVGDATAGMYPLQLAPRDDFGEGALLAFLGAEGALTIPPPPPPGPRSMTMRPPPPGRVHEGAEDTIPDRPLSRPPHTRSSRVPPARATPLVPRNEDSLGEHAREMGALATEIRVLASRGDAVAMRTVIAKLEALACGTEPGAGSREALAAGALRVLENVELLAPIADAALCAPMATADAARAVLASARATGATALCAARVRARAKDARARFLSAIHELGGPASSSVVAALDRVSTSGDADAALVEDLLRAMPHALDDHAASVASRYVHHPQPSVRREALVALALAHGVNARDRLIAALDDRDDAVRLAAVAMLRQIGTIEAGAIDALGRILSGAGNASHELRAKAAAALADAKDHGAAVAILMHAIEPPKNGMLGAMLRATRDEATEVVEATARVLLMLGGDAGRRAVQRRADECSGKTRARLLTVLTRGAAHGA